MKQNIITEIVEFNVNLDVTDEEFVKIVGSLEENFHSQHRGFLDTELVKGKDRKWIMIQHWESMEEVKNVIKLMMKEPATEEFRKSIDPTSVKMMLLEKIKTWSK